MRLLGILLFILGGAGMAFSTWSAYQRSRPQDVLFGVLAPVAALVMLLGLLLAFVPGFFG